MQWIQGSKAWLWSRAADLGSLSSSAPACFLVQWCLLQTWAVSDWKSSCCSGRFWCPASLCSLFQPGNDIPGLFEIRFSLQMSSFLEHQKMQSEGGQVEEQRASRVIWSNLVHCVLPSPLSPVLSFSDSCNSIYKASTTNVIRYTRDTQSTKAWKHLRS